MTTMASQNGCRQNGTSQSTFDPYNNNNTLESKTSAKLRVSFSDNSESTVSSRHQQPRPSLVEMYTSKRWGITFLSSLVITLSLTLRMCMSMAIVCMVKPVSTNENQTLNFTHVNMTAKVQDNDEWLVDWDSATQGQILASYFYGFPFFCVLGGWAAGKYSGKRVLLVMVTTLSVASMAIPYAAITSPYLVIGIRVIVGLAAGGIMPCVNQILAKWAPLNERSQIIATASSVLKALSQIKADEIAGNTGVESSFLIMKEYSTQAEFGQVAGNVLTFVLSGVICTIPYQNGWPFIFYIFGILNLMMMVIWCKVVYNHPEDHPSMTKSEISYIVRGRRDSANVKMPDPPWLKILMSPPFWAILSAHMSFGFIFATMGTFLPLYMNDVMKFDTAMNGVVSAAPFVGRLLGTVVSGYIADMCFTKGWMSTRTIRITFQTIGMIGSAPFLCGLAFLDERHKELAVCLLILYWFIQGASSSGFRVNHLDIAPRFAGVINGMTMTCGALAAMASPLITSAVLVYRTPDEWRIVFLMCVGVGIVGTILFDCLAQGEEQHWAQDTEIEISIGEERSKSGSIISSTIDVLPAVTVSHMIKGTGKRGFIENESKIDQIMNLSDGLDKTKSGNIKIENKITENGNTLHIHHCDNKKAEKGITRQDVDKTTKFYNRGQERGKHDLKNRKSLTLIIPRNDNITESSRL